MNQLGPLAVRDRVQFVERFCFQVKAWVENEVKRIFDSGVAELLFPRDFYFLNHRTLRDNMIEFCRKQIKKTWRWTKNGTG